MTVNREAKFLTHLSGETIIHPMLDYCSDIIW